MSYDRTKPGYLNVDYCGPLFKTRFGKIMYDSDDVLGSIIFNRDGDHRAAATAVIPNYEDLVCEASTTMATGSRVFLRASGARFVVRKGQIACRDIQAKVDVEATGYSADYFHDAIHRLARAMSDRFGDLTEQFDEFKSFRRLVQSVALAKWLKRHAIAFDWQPLKTYTVTAVDIPAQVPRSAWYSLFNGRNLDGWRLNTTTQELEWSIVDGALRLRPTGAKPVEMLVQSYGKNLELRFTVVTEGPVDFIIRKGTGDEGALVSIDTKGRPQKIELFLIDGAWTAIAPGFGRQGKLTYPKVARRQRSPAAAELGRRPRSARFQTCPLCRSSAEIIAMFSLLLALPLALAQEPPQMKIQGNGSLRHPSLVRAIVITPDSRTAFVGLNDGSLLAYSLQLRQAVEVGKRDFGIVLSLALNRRGDLLAAGDSYGNLRIFDTATLKLVSSRKFKNDDPERIVFHPNGDSLFVAFDTGHLLKLDTAGLATQHDILPTKGSHVLALDCSQDGKTVATADREGNVKLWSSRDLDSIKTWKAHDIFALPQF